MTKYFFHVKATQTRFIGLSGRESLRKIPLNSPIKALSIVLVLLILAGTEHKY